MRWHFSTGLLAIVVLGWGVATANAQIALRLQTADSEVPTRSALQTETAQDDTLLVHGWRRRCWWGGACFTPRFYGFSCYRPYVYGFGFYQPFFYGYSCYPSFSFGFSYYRPYSFYWAPPVYFQGFCPIRSGSSAYPVISLRIDSPATVVQPSRGLPPQQANPPFAPSPGTFPYDGGPANPVPMPAPTPAPMTHPQSVPALELRQVSFPSSRLKFAYPAYGDQRTTETSARKQVRR